MNQFQIQVGQVVSLPGKFDRGVVTRVRFSTSRKILNMAKRFAPDIRNAMEKTADRCVAEVRAGKGLWTVGVGQLALVAKAASKSEVQEAQNIAREIKNRRFERKDAQFTKSLDAGFLDVKAGAPIEINFSDIGWAAATFVRVNSGGRITYSRHGRERHASASIVRLATKATTV